MNALMEEIKEMYNCQVTEDGILLRTPIMYDAADHTFSFLIRQCGENAYTVTDRGQTLEYLRENMNPNKYAEKIARICEHFEIEQIGGEFVGTLASLASGQTLRNLHKFIGTMHMIACIDVLAD